jgi:diguanylate cyclase (GGDEF)-like protein
MSERETRVDPDCPAEREIAERLATVRVGCLLALVVSLGAAAYSLLTWERPDRELLLVLAAVAMLTVPVVAALPTERIVRGRWREPFFVVWSGCYVALIAVGIGFDGGIASPFTLMLVMPLLFGAISYPLRGAVIVGLLAVIAYLIVAISSGEDTVISITGAFALATTAVLCSWLARDQAARRDDLASTAEALRESEGTSKLLARRQRYVADFGQLALEGAGIDTLCQEAAEILQRALDVDAAGLLKYLPDQGALEIRNATGIASELVGTRIPAGRGSQSGYTLTTGKPVAVSDWTAETRFSAPAPVEELGLRSGLTALIRAKDNPYGVLIVQHRRPRQFGPDEISFVQSLANVLANAIERRSAEERTRHEALHDPLTGLPNRTLFLDRLGHALAQSARRDSSVAVLFLDLDQFKLVNDSLGHAAGDGLLQAVGERFTEVLRPEDTVARFGGDEFAVLVEDVEAERDATRVAERIAKALTRPFILRRREHFVSVSVGISIGTGGEGPEALIRDADAALYRAKERGRGRYEIFDSVMRARAVEHMQTENDLRRALDRDEFVLLYQPQISLADGSVAAMEALLRWRHPKRGLLAPAGFIRAAEESQLILPIGYRVIDEACRAAAAWQALEPDRPPTRVSINLSARQLTDNELPRVLAEAIDASGIDPLSVELEMTETALLEESEAPERCVQRLKEVGVRLVLDDFGTGFSSLGYLRRFPLDGIKLDRTFIEDAGAGSADPAIVRAIIEMAAALGLDVAAEGVETAEQLRAVGELGCNLAQGFYLSPTVARGEIAELLREQPWGDLSLRTA